MEWGNKGIESNPEARHRGCREQRHVDNYVVIWASYQLRADLVIEIISIHIPKTAGMSFHDILRQ
ncbi:unnamed protein product, partial [marine sediment metagenome]